MRELELAGHPSIDPIRALGAGGRARFRLSRTAFIVSIGVHVVAGYALSRAEWSSLPPPPNPIAEFFLFEMPRPPPEAAPVPEPEAAPVPEPLAPPPAEIREPPRAAPPERAPAPRAAEPVAPPAVVVAPPETEAGPAPREPSSAELVEARERAAQEVVSERNAEREYLTFSMDDVAPPRPEPEEKPERSIFDGGGADFGGRSVGTVGQQRTKFGRKLAEFCNALTGGFGVAFQGFGLFNACGRPDNEPSGLFPEVRPAYLDLMPECVDTRDTAPALALEAPFPTVKCRLVEQEDPGREP
jgi:hypothetical protein